MVHMQQTKNTTQAGVILVATSSELDAYGYIR